MGWPSKVQFGNLSSYEQDQIGTLFHNIMVRFEGVIEPDVMLGDATYPLLPWLTKQQTTPAQLAFNNQGSDDCREDIWAS